MSNVARMDTVGRVQDNVARRFELEQKYIINNSQSDPINILIGRDALSMTQLLPMFDLVTEAGESKGKSGSSSSQTYFAGLDIAFCVGKVFSIYKIWNGDADLIWESMGAVDGTKIGANGEGWNADGYNELNITDYGNIRIYQGTQTQPIDKRFCLDGVDQSVLIDGTTDPVVNLEGPWPAYRNLFHIVSEKLKIGSSNTTPNIRIELQVVPEMFVTENANNQLTNDYDWITYGGSAIRQINGIPVYNNAGDTYPPLIIYEYLRNDTWGGAGISALDIDTKSFYDALYICAKEGILISATIDNDTTIRDAISQVLEYCDGILCLDKNGKLKLKLIRVPDDKSTIKRIGVSLLCEEPTVRWLGTDDAIGCTKISFNSRIDNYESSSVVFESPRYSGSTLNTVTTQEIDLPFCKTRLLASRLARRIGNASALPSYEIDIVVLPSDNDYEVGDLIYLTYEKLGINNLLLRITKVRFGSSEDPKISITAVSQVDTDWNIDIDEDYLATGWPSKSTGVIYTPQGFLRPYVLAMNDKNGFAPYQAVVFVEKNKYLDDIGYCFRASNDRYYYNYLSAYDQGTFFDCYQTKIKLVEWGVKTETGNSVPFQYVKIQVSGDYRKDEIAKLVNTGKEVFLTFCSYKNPTFEENLTDPNFTRALLPMSFKVLFSNFDLNSGSDYSVAPKTTGEENVFEYWLKVSNVEFISGCVYPDTLSQNKFYPSQTGFIYTYQPEKHCVAQFVGLTQMRYFLKKISSFLSVNVKLRDGREEVFGGVFRQYYTESGYTHTVMNEYQRDQNYENMTYEDAWGLPVRNACGNIKSGVWGNEVIAAGSEEEATLYIDQYSGKVYHNKDGVMTETNSFLTNYQMISIRQLPVGTTAGTVAAGDHNHDDRYQLKGESAERYYYQLSASGTFEHTAGSCGLIYLQLTNETPIILTLPSASGAQDGDVITIVSTVDDGVTQNSVTINAATGEILQNGLSTLSIGTGIILNLICTTNNNNKQWLQVLQSKNS